MTILEYGQLDTYTLELSVSDRLKEDDFSVVSPQVNLFYRFPYDRGTSLDLYVGSDHSNFYGSRREI